MILHRSLLVVAAVGLGLLQGGCASSSEEVDVEITDSLGLEPLEGNGGSQGGNGLPTVDFNAHVLLLWTAMDLGINDENNTSVSSLKNDPTSETLKYAVRCAMPAGSSVQGFTGGGILSTTSDWLRKGLSVPQKEDVLTCMIAHLNPYDVEVPLQLKGYSVTDSLTTAYAAQFTVKEGLWVARQVGSTFQYIVWPLDTLQLQCPNTQNALLTRVCATGQEPGDMIPDCPVEVRETTLDEDCEKDLVTGKWTCLGHPAIETRLSPTSYLALYTPGCYPIPQ